MKTKLFLYNTQTRSKEAFQPLHADHVGLYVCGPTVYDTAHIGNARPVVVFDVLYRLLSYLYPKVIYVRNITDVDDKIIKAARENDEDIDRLTQCMTERYHQDMGALHALPPTIEPRATLHIPHMIQVIETLLEKGHAYTAEGHVLFDVNKYDGYGQLSRRQVDEMIAGARVEVAPYKKQAHDFVLWKPAKDTEVGWESPWGFGRPGWHIECSAMSVEYLGQPFDIHGGGIDLVFPHHENERAQSCACAGKELARYWMHNGHLIVDGEKMSKSLGNFFTVHDKLKEMPGEVIRFVLLATHYRQPLDWTSRAVTQARNTLDRFYQALRDYDNAETSNDTSLTYDHDFLKALCDDLNIPEALTILHRYVSEINRVDDHLKKRELQRNLLHNAKLLGLLQYTAEEWFRWEPEAKRTDKNHLSDALVQQMIDARNQARKTKDFAKADQLRDALQDAGIQLEDTPEGTQWRRG